MFQTEFCGPDYKLLISWDQQNCQNYSFDDSIDSDQEIFYKLNELYQNISNFSTEFVNCIKSVHGAANLEQIQSHLHENNPNVTVKIENLKNTETYNDEIFLLKQEVEKLKQENEQLNEEYKIEIIKLQSEFAEKSKIVISEQESKLNSLKQELEDKYNLEMSDLRKYFENKCTESFRQFTEESYQCSRDSDTDSYSDDETDENYEKFEKSRIDHATKDLQKILDKDLKNFKKAYVVEVERLKTELKNKKDQEIMELKRTYSVKFEALQSELNRLLEDKMLEDSVKLVHSEVKTEYEAELNKLNGLSDEAFVAMVETERRTYENDLIEKHQEELKTCDEEWSNHVESSLSDLTVESALKAVIKETKLKSQSCNCSPSKKNKLKETTRLLKQKYKREIEDLRNDYEDRLASISMKYEKELEKLNEENYALICQNKELLELNELNIKEVDKLKYQLKEGMKLINSPEEQEIIEKIKDELSKMKTQYDVEVSSLREDNQFLEQTVQELRDNSHNFESDRQNILSSLENEIKALIQKEKNGENVVWPTELQNIERIFSVKYNESISNLEMHKKESPDVEEHLSISNEKNQIDTLYGHSYQDGYLDLETILKERETLQKIIITLYTACEGFRKYITNLEEDRDNTLNNELCKIGLTSCDNVTLSNLLKNFNDTEKESLKTIPLMNIFDPEESLNITLDGYKSFNQSELSCWFEKLKNDAAAILCLTSGKKVEHFEQNESAVQTEVDAKHFDEVQKTIESLKEEISLYEKQYAKAQEDIDKLTQEVVRLNDKINSLESLEGYGEGFNSVPNERRLSGACSDNLSQPAFPKHIDEFCSECDKLKDEAKRNKEDLESQVEAANEKLKSLKLFLERETAEREFEREEFDKLQKQLKEKDRELCSLNNYSTELNVLEQNLKELQNDYEETKNKNNNLETELAALIDKVETFRERNRELESKLAEKSESAENAVIKMKEMDKEIEQLQQENQNMRQEIDSLKDDGVKQLETWQEQHEVGSELFKQVKTQLIEVEKAIMCRTRELENNCVTASSSTVVSSPSEDVSVCERIDRLRLASPSGSDTTSSPIHFPVDLLLCLQEKLKKLFRAEDVVLKRIGDQEMEFNRLTNLLDELQLEKDTLQEKLNETTTKLAEAKIKLDNWQHRSNTTQSHESKTLMKRIESLESEIEVHQKCVLQKDAALKESTKKAEILEKNIKNMEKEFADKTRQMNDINENLRQELRLSCREISKIYEMLVDNRKEDHLSLSTIVERLLEEKNGQIEELKNKLEQLHCLNEMAEKSHSTEIDSKGSSKRVNFTETLESFADFSDHTRHAPVFDSIVSPKNVSFSSAKKPLLGFSESESSSVLQPILESEEQLIKAEAPIQKVTFKDDSIKVNLDDLSWTRVPNEMNIESTKIDLENINDSKSTYRSEMDTKTEKSSVNVLQSEMELFKNELENEKKNHFSTLIQLRELNSNWEAEKKQLKDAETEYTKEKAALETKLKNLEWENVACKDQCHKNEQRILILVKDLETKKEAIEELKIKLNDMENLKTALKDTETKHQVELEQLKQKDQKLMELSTLLETEKIKTQELHENYEKWFKAVVKERVSAQMKCEEYSQNLKTLNDELSAEKSKSEKLAIVVERFDHKKLEEVDNTIKELQYAKEEIARLKKVIERLQQALEKANREITDMKQKKEETIQQNALAKQRMVESSTQSDTLKDLTEKVQKQVELAALWDKNMMLNLECDSKTELFIEELAKLSPIGEDLRFILLKILQGGFDTLNTQEREILQAAYYAFDYSMPNKVVQLESVVQELSDAARRLRSELDAEKKNSKGLQTQNYDQQLEINRMEIVHNYFEWRISFLISKVDEYRNKVMKAEIELTTEKTSRRQADMAFECYKKQALEKQSQNKTKLEEALEQFNVTSNENLKLKQETELLKNKIESLIAELNSVKVITQYHSDSESELSRSLNPMKARLNEMEEKYSKLKHDYEKRKIELRTLKSNLNLERSSCKKLESILKEMSTEKQKLEKQLMETKGKMEDLNWQKQKLEDKLKAAELAEMKRRRTKISQEFTKKEVEYSKELQRKLEKDCQEFQKSITKLIDKLASVKNNCKQVFTEAQRIFLRMLRAESSQRSLVYQKNFLIVTLSEYERRCNHIVRNITSSSKYLTHYVLGDRITLKQKFKSLVFCVISMHRMQFLSNRRNNNNFVRMRHYFITHVPEIGGNEEFFDALSVRKVHIRELKKENVDDDPEDIALQNICQQYAVLKDKYVTGIEVNARVQ